MSPDYDALIAELRKKDELIKTQLLEIERARFEIQLLEEAIRKFQREKFSPSSEKSTGQLSLFNEAEVEASRPEAIDREVQAHRRAKPVRKPLPDHLPRVEIVHDLSEEEKLCPCGAHMHVMGEEVSEQLDLIPAKIQVLRHKRLKYGCRSCHDTVRQASMPAQPIPKSNASPGLLAQIIMGKYGDHLPLYRQEAIFRRLGIDLGRTTLARWVIETAGLLRPLYQMLQEDLQEAPVLCMDETTVQVLKGSGKAPTSPNYMWVRCRYGPDKPIVLLR